MLAEETISRHGCLIGETPPFFCLIMDSRTASSHLICLLACTLLGSCASHDGDGGKPKSKGTRTEASLPADVSEARKQSAATEAMAGSVEIGGGEVKVGKRNADGQAIRAIAKGDAFASLPVDDGSVLGIADEVTVDEGVVTWHGWPVVRGPDGIAVADEKSTRIKVPDGSTMDIKGAYHTLPLPDPPAPKPEPKKRSVSQKAGAPASTTSPKPPPAAAAQPTVDRTKLLQLMRE